MATEAKLAGMERLLADMIAAPGALSPEARKQAAAATGAAPLTAYVDTVARHAYRVTDEDMRALLAAGCSEDQVFEATLCTALGAGIARFAAGLRGMGR